MDPVACLIDRIIGCRGADRREAEMDLRRWIDRGGFRPTVADVATAYARKWHKPFPPAASRTLARFNLPSGIPE